MPNCRNFARLCLHHHFLEDDLITFTFFSSSSRYQKVTDLTSSNACSTKSIRLALLLTLEDKYQLTYSEVFP